MDYKFTNEVVNKVATMLIYSEIGGEGVSGEAFARELAYLDSDEMVDEITIRINTPGGSISEGLAIVSAIQNCNKTVNTVIDGLAASMGSVIAVAGDKRYMNDFGLIMIHDPHVGVPENELDEKTKKALYKFKSAILTIYETKTNQNKGFISDLMSQETWLDASEALSYKFVDEIIKTDAKVKNEDLAELDSNKIFNTFVDVVNSLNKPKIDKMEQVANYLNLAEATESNVLDALKAKESKITELKNSITDLTAKAEELDTVKNELEGYKTKELEGKTAKAEELVNSLIKDGKLEEEGKELWTSKAVENFEEVKNLFGAIKFKASAKIVTPKAQSTIIPEDRKDWSFADWDKNDSEGLAKLKEQDEGTYTDLLNAYKEQVIKNNTF
jgi:ATP-dependent Clp protease protease subunit